MKKIYLEVENQNRPLFKYYKKCNLKKTDYLNIN